MVFEEANITEPGEKEIARNIHTQWDAAKPLLGRLSPDQFESLRKLVGDLVVVNERGMFELAQDNERLSRKVLIGALIYFAISLLLSILFADNLSERLSLPLKNIAEELHRRPAFGRGLKLPEPTSLELLILTTELKRLWERLSETEKVNVAELLQEKTKLETLLESVDDGLLVLGAEGRILHCNDRIGKLIELPKEQIQDHFWRDLPTNHENYLKLRDALREGMTDGQQIELISDHSTVFFSARSRGIGTGRPRHHGVLFLLHDITEKKQREKFRSEFIDLLSHELKTPLQSLGTASELLGSRKAVLPEELRLLVDTITEDVERIRAVAQEFVQITQSQAKIMKLKLELVAVNQLLPEWIKPFHVVAKDREVRLEFVHEGSEVIWGNLDLAKFPWVVSNLLSNAVRFSPKGGTVTVRLTDRNGFVEIQVIDEGPGVPESEQARMYEPFYQSTMMTSTGSRGLFGIGLTIAKEVVEAHDGRIEYYRRQPHGSEFRILLPFPPLQYREELKSWTH